MRVAERGALGGVSAEREPSADDLALRRRIDELHLELPCYGSRRMTFELNKEGRGVNRQRVQRLMRLIGLEGLVPRPGASKANPENKIYPYLVRGLTITEPNHVWASDITYIPMAHGFLNKSRHHQLGQPRGAFLAAVEHHGHALVHRGAGGGLSTIRQAATISDNAERIVATIPTRARNSPARPSRASSKPPA